METVPNNNNNPHFNIRPATASAAERATDRKVFVTQLNDRDEEEFNINVAAVANDPTAVNKFKTRQLQQTVLLKYKVSEEEINKTLRDKRLAFQTRIRLCREKQEQLIRMQQENEKRVKQFETFITEKENKRKKAIVRYQDELKFKLQKILEHDILLTEFDKLNTKHLKLQSRLEKGKHFKDYLTKVIDLLPENYLEATGESKYMSLILRHQTLEESNHDLFDSLMSNADKLKALRTEYERLVVQHSQNKMEINIKLNELQKIKDQLDSRNAQAEEDLVKNGEKYRTELLDLAEIFSGIDNLAERCATRYSMPIKDMTLSEKLDAVQNYIMEKTLVLKQVKTNMTDEEYQDALVRKIED